MVVDVGLYRKAVLYVALAEKPRDAVVKFDTYRNVQRHRAVIPAIAWHLVPAAVHSTYCTAYIPVFGNKLATLM